MRTFFYTLLFALLPLGAALFAGEGMWLPLFLASMNEAEMQAMGMKISAEDIYSVNRGSLKDAIVSFGGFCTGEVISSQGLVLTNHHCGYGQIQQHSSLEHNYLDDGFWAASHAEELPNPGLFVTFIVRMEDVTSTILAGVTPEMTDKERTSLVDTHLNELRSSYVKEPWEDIMIRPFFHGNQYFLFVTETYRDVRLVGTPPSSIGKFGADTDNWEWPRHTGDFSMFRIYAGPDNKPADYSPNNVPFQPRHHLPVSMDGVAEGDFTMVFGFPGRTDEYLPGVAAQQRTAVINPVAIGLRDQSLGILNKAMRENPEARIQYASKQARLANAWKKWIGESQGFEATDGLGRKKALEDEFTKRINDNPEWRRLYGNILPTFERYFKDIEPYAVTRTYVTEIMGRNVELFSLVSTMHSILKAYQSSGYNGVQARIPRLKEYLEGFYKDFNAEIDREIAILLMEVYFKQVQMEHQSPYARDEMEFSGGSTRLLMEAIYSKSILTKPGMVLKMLDENPEGFLKQVGGDYAYLFSRGVLDFTESEVYKRYNELNERIDALQRKYMEALMVVFPEKRFYPDANSTMRVTYGQVEGYSVGDTLKYDFYTTLDGLMEKYKPGDYEFDVPARLRELHASKDFGPYANADGSMPVCFLGSNHTTGGNSGSPAIDANGNLIGLNFDRTWHGTMSDINYDRSICRNIMVDARYILFIVDKFAGAGHLVEEMTLVHPKQ